MSDRKPAAKKKGGGHKGPVRVLFVCTGNAARSQMAEGLANRLGDGRLEAQSAGTFPAGLVMAHAVAVLKERGIDISAHYSKGLDEVKGPFDIVVTLCDSAEKECPARLLKGRHEHWSTFDPTFVEGGPEQVREAFRKVRNRLEEQILSLRDRLVEESGA